MPALSRPPADSPLGQLMSTLPRPGRVEWIGLRPARGVAMREVESAEAAVGAGLAGDRYKGGSGKRDVTLIQAEHLPVIAALAGHAALAPATLRRCRVVAGSPVGARMGRRFRRGEVVLEGAGRCGPGWRMEEGLGRRGFNARRGHGGLWARIVSGGTLRVGDAVVALAEEAA